MKEKLEEAIKKYFRGLLKKHGLRLVKEFASGVGALKDFESENLFLRIVNDKGIVSLEIAPKSNPEKIYDIALYKELREPPAQGNWNLSLQEQADYLEDNWAWFNTHLSGAKIDQTLEKLEYCSRKRVKKIFGEYAQKGQ